tara:strand:+ start:5380 stop:5538 length:159 start_codon:yes stop_codon:yes gene_type:complete
LLLNSDRKIDRVTKSPNTWGGDERISAQAGVATNKKGRKDLRRFSDYIVALD